MVYLKAKINFLLLVMLLGISVKLVLSKTKGSEEIKKELSKLKWWQQSFETYKQREIDEDEEPKPPVKASIWGGQFDTKMCSTVLSSQVREEIQSYEKTVERIFQASTKGVFAGRTHGELAGFVDKFGNRISGSEALEDSITYMESVLRKKGFSDVKTEKAIVPKWTRGDERANMIYPLKKQLNIKGLGLSVPTSKEGVEAEVIVVDSFDDLKNKKDEMKGKIIVYNSHGSESSIFHIIGARLAAKNGAIAAMSRSGTSFSLYSPNTGITYYDDSVPKIPIASITHEDGDLIERLSKEGKVVVNLRMESEDENYAESRNLIGDYKGWKHPEEFLALAGHLDSWDVGQGAIDDGVGPILALTVVDLLRELKLRPKRTIRTMMFTGEELGLYGARAWIRNHEDEIEKYKVAMEADYGCLVPAGLLFSGNQQFGCILSEILGMFGAEVNATSLIQTKNMPTDIYVMIARRVPGIVLDGDGNERYFWYYHTDADMMTAFKSHNLDVCLAIWASTSYILSDLSENIQL